jgi:hypothetical protein
LRDEAPHEIEAIHPRHDATFAPKTLPPVSSGLRTIAAASCVA